MDTSAGSRRGKANCRFCGQPWFGEVAYCPYCGRQAASAPAGTDADAPLAPALQATDPPAVKQPARALADRPGTRWKFPWVSAAAALAFVAIGVAVNELAVPTGDTAGPQSAMRAPAVGDAGSSTEASDRVTAPVAPDPGASASIAQAPRAAEPAMPRADVAPPAPHRSLCSAANEAAGLCNPQ